MNGTLFKPKPTEVKFKLFTNLKGTEVMGNEGRHSNPIHEIKVGFTLGWTSDRRALADIWAELPVEMICLLLNAIEETLSG